ncbi:MAG: permease [Chloroflexi bacterium RBG_16_48_8]|nr:MAG: permease [Chloroflexi bacterium RBG_16_48_8]
MKALRSYKGFARLFYATLISAIGDNIHRIALMVLVYTIKEEALWVSLTLGIQLLTSVVVGPIISTWSDAQERRKLLVATDLLRVPLVLLIPLVGMKSLVVLLILVFVMEILRILHNPVIWAVVPELVPEEEMDTANSMMLFTGRFAEVVFVGLAGLLVATVGAAPAFWIDAGTFLASGLIVLGLPSIEPGRKEEAGYWSRVREGIDHLFKNPSIRRTVGTLFCAAMFGSVEAVLGVVLAVSILKVGSSGFGVMEAAMALGAILGTLIVPQMTSRIGREKLFLMGLLGFGLFEASIGLLPRFNWVLVAFFMSGILNMAFLVPARSILQLHTPPELRTRTFAAFGAVMNTAVLVGTMLGGALEEPLGITLIFVLAGMGVFAVTLSVLVKGQLSQRRPIPSPQARAEMGAD